MNLKNLNDDIIKFNGLSNFLEEDFFVIFSNEISFVDLE
jgi:hypothetical protein